MRRLLPIFLSVFALFALPACGGHTGLEIRVDVPNELVPGTDFNRLRVQVDAQEGGSAGESYTVTANSPKPYTVYVFSDKTQHFKVSLRVELWQDNAIKKTKLVPDVVLEQGEVKLLAVDMSQ